MDLSFLKDVGGLIKDLATIILPIIGVFVGARLSRRTGDDQWLKKERLAAYLTLMDQLDDMLTNFAVGRRVSKFTVDADEFGHDYDGVEMAWHDQMDELKRAEVRVAILGGTLGSIYDDTANQLISEMLDAIEDDDITEDEWAELSRRGYKLQNTLIRSAKADLEVPATRGRRKLLARVD